MRVEHVGIWVLDLEAMRGFYADVLGGAAGDSYENPATGFRSCFVTFDGGGRVELMHIPELGARLGDGNRQGWSHLALALPSEAGVEEMTARLSRAGCVIASAPRRTGDGYFESVILDPEGNRIELVAE